MQANFSSLRAARSARERERERERYSLPRIDEDMEASIQPAMAYEEH